MQSTQLVLHPTQVFNDLVDYIGFQLSPRCCSPELGSKLTCRVATITVWTICQDFPPGNTWPPYIMTEFPTKVIFCEPHNTEFLLTWCMLESTTKWMVKFRFQSWQWKSPLIHGVFSSWLELASDFQSERVFVFFFLPRFGFPSFRWWDTIVLR